MGLKLVRIGEHKASPLLWTASLARVGMVEKQRFFPFTRKFHSLCHSPAESKGPPYHSSPPSTLRLEDYPPQGMEVFSI